jgi:hypothetical protein
VSHSKVGVAVVVFRDGYSKFRVVESDRNDEVDDAKEAPSKDNFGTGMHVDAAVDGDGKAFGGPSEGVGQVLSHSVPYFRVPSELNPNRRGRPIS